MVYVDGMGSYGWSDSLDICQDLPVIADLNLY
jgi:hypothetical protein